jgi:Mrp family chromosome partitioning ATPase/predicted Fe-Mo cluster-binding NifX family protein
MRNLSSCNVPKKDEQDQQIEQFLSGVKHKLLVMSGKGGVGKSTVAANMSLALSSLGYRVGLLDADLHGPSIAGLLGLIGLPLNAIGGHIEPFHVTENLKVVTIQGILREPDTALIWRGPVKISVIKQFLAEVKWGELDFLIIDSPPGTGDEPLTVAQTIKGCKAIVVTTPQEVALADVRKSLAFCREVGLNVLGMIENMSGFVCPSCGTTHDIFKSGGGERLARDWSIPFLGKIPIDPAVVEAADMGLGIADRGNVAKASMQNIINTVLSVIEEQNTKGDATRMKIAVPVANGKLCNHFGHCEQFAIVEVENGNTVGIQHLVPPPHEPGVIPNWLAEQNVTKVLAGGMGEKALAIFAQKGIDVVCGVRPDIPEKVVERYLAGNLETTTNACSHDEGEHHHCH